MTLSRVFVAGGLALLLAGCATPRNTAPSAGAPAPPAERPGRPVERVYLVQLDQVDAKARADSVVAATFAWWRTLRPRPEALASYDDPPVRIVWKPPFYRVRLGPFITEQRARAALQTAQSAFPNAFVVPHRVAP
ncbi:SPOR domain-containing protein [Salisaeta longa]|uniref:SPOR domain-containing protein n=1 Tax=Salisaeta longa TaxID=503170 RepID=UPI00040597C6|nr:SPOR domain-containing protein [Salisaeta longa]